MLRAHLNLNAYLLFFQHVPSKVAVSWDGWSTKRRRPYSSLGVHFVDSPVTNPNDWSLKSYVLAFEPTVGRHTGKEVGKEIVRVLRKFEISEKVLITRSVNQFLTFSLLASFSRWGQCYDK